MSKFDKAFRAFNRHSASDARALAALRERLDNERPPRRFPLLLAAAVLLSAAVASVYAWSDREDTGVSPPLAGGSPNVVAGDARALLLPLRESGDTQVSPLVALQWLGEGDVGGDERAPRIAWLQGTLHVDVVPEHHVDLVVTTDEARVQVHGTAFSVVRDAMGTSVTVDHGVVSVDCAGGVSASLTVGMTQSCRPVHAAPLLRRARALQEENPAAALVDVEEALRDSARPAMLDDELRAVRVALLGRCGRNAEAVAAAVAYVRGGGSRTSEVARLGLGLGATDAAAQVLAGANE